MSAYSQVLIQRLDTELPLPSREMPGDAGFDIYTREDVCLEPGQRQLIPTGIAIALPDGFVAFVSPRSGLALKHGITLVNAPGIIDSGYRGEIGVIGLNTGANSCQLFRGDRIAQLVILELPQIEFLEVKSLPGSIRSSGGFGSTGGFETQA
jgi:dUTP pyrophosphatase